MKINFLRLFDFKKCILTLLLLLILFYLLFVYIMNIIYLQFILIIFIFNVFLLCNKNWSFNRRTSIGRQSIITHAR